MVGCLEYYNQDKFSKFISFTITSKDDAIDNFKTDCNDINVNKLRDIYI